MLLQYINFIDIVNILWKCQKPSFWPTNSQLAIEYKPVERTDLIVIIRITREEVDWENLLKVSVEEHNESLHKKATWGSKNHPLIFPFVNL